MYDYQPLKHSSQWLYVCFHDRFDKLLQLLTQHRPLLEAMEEVGITRDEVVTLQHLKLKMMEKQRQQQQQTAASNVRYLNHNFKAENLIKRTLL